MPLPSLPSGHPAPRTGLTLQSRHGHPQTLQEVAHG